MKKRLLIFFVFFLFLSFIPITTYAKEYSCSELNDTVTSYDELIEELEKIDCANTTDSDEIDFCNEGSLKKSFYLSKLFKFNDRITGCKNNRFSEIIKENKDNCTNVYGSSLKDLTNSVMSAFYMIAPFLIIIFGSLDFSRIVVMNDPKVIKEARTNFFKRLIAFILLYMVPALVSFALDFNLSNYTLTGNVYSCKNDYIFYMDKWNFTYIPPVNASSNGSSNSNSNLGLGANNGLFPVRTEKPADGGYYDYSTGFQCVWYARSRAVEALMTSNLSDKETRANKVKNASDNGWAWYAMSVPGVQYATRDEESTTVDALVGFQNSDDYTKPRAGSLVSWQWTDEHCNVKNPGGQCYGHVAFVEDVNEDTNQVLVSDGWEKGGFGFQSNWYDISYMEHFGGNYNFEGYVYLFDPMKSN